MFCRINIALPKDDRCPEGFWMVTKAKRRPGREELLPSQAYPAYMSSLPSGTKEGNPPILMKL